MRVSVPMVGRFPRDEVRDRNRPLGRLDAQLVQRRDRPLVCGQAQHDIDRIIGAGRAEIGHLQPEVTSCTVAPTRTGATPAGRFGPIDLQFPVDAGQRQAIDDIDDIRHGDR